MAIIKGFFNISGLCSTQVHEPGSGLSTSQISGRPGFVLGLADSTVLHYRTHGWTLLRLRFDLQDSPWTLWLVRKFGRDRDPGWLHEPAIFKYRAVQFHVYSVWPPNTCLGLKSLLNLKVMVTYYLKIPRHAITQKCLGTADIVVRALEMSSCLTLKPLQKEC